MNCGLSTVVWRWSTVSIKVIRIWSLHHPPLQREQPLWCAGMNTSKCMWLNIVSYYCLLGDFPSEVNSVSLSHWIALSRTSEGEAEIKMLFGFFFFFGSFSRGKLFERFISNSYSCQADLKLWNFRNVWFSPEPSSNQTELKLSTTCVQSNTCWLLRTPLQSGHVHQGLLLLLLYCDWFLYFISHHSTPFELMFYLTTCWGSSEFEAFGSQRENQEYLMLLCKLSRQNLWDESTNMVLTRSREEVLGSTYLCFAEAFFKICR